MTVQQLLSWVAFAHDRRDCSYDEVTDKHTICLKQALIESTPKIETHGYGTSNGELELAIVLIHTCNYNEVCEMENEAYNISQQPMNIPTNVSNGIPAPEPFYISATEAIRRAEADRAFNSDVVTPTLHNTPNNERPVGEILYESRPIPGMAPAPSMPPIVPYTMGETTTFESPLRALSVEESRAVLSEALASYTQPAQGATISPTTTINNEFERFFESVQL